MNDKNIDVLCEAAGIALSYADAEGNTQSASEDGKRYALQALGIAMANDAEIADSVAQFRARRNMPLPPLVTVAAGAPARLALWGDGPHEWSLTTEDGVHRGGRGAESIDLPSMAAGYHHLTLRNGHDGCETTLIAAPSRCYLPSALNDGGVAWGATAQVYSLRGRHDVGLGSYADVAVLAEAVGERGGAFLGLSPVHALFGADPSKYSPYSPSSRLFLQTGLIAVHDVPGFDPSDCEGVEAGGALIDYGRILPKQRAILEGIWARTRVEATSALAAFRTDGGERLVEHATFEALSDHCEARGERWLGEWPDAFRDVHSREVAAFRRDHAERIDFHIWLQWLADQQLAVAAGAARAQTMAVGLYRDLAVGADRGGSEFWSTPDAFVNGLSVGAPPDPLGPLGQDWGLPPLHPLALASSGLGAFRELVVANMRHAGAIRIDHAFQLQRLFVLPVGGTATDGVYLDYPLEALLAALKIESHRAKCLVIGEDLGTAPAGFSDAIMVAGMLSYRLLPFERGSGGVFKEPNHYPRSALAALSTHDLPTFAGWWRGLDVDVRECLGVFDTARATRERAGRGADRDHLIGAFAAEGVEADGATLDRPPDIAALRYLARTPCALVAVQIEDILREQQQANLPGPDCGHPNWRRRLPIPVEAIGRHPNLDRVAAAFSMEGRSEQRARNIPRATYRLQLHKDFTFDDAAAVVPYLARLGISHVYTSPIQKARPGSTHGYDIVDPTQLNPELGGVEAFRRFSDAIAAHDVRLLVDIVPNHVGVGGDTNPWWLDVLEWGRMSPKARCFDIDWEKPGADGKLVVPFLGKTFDTLLDEGDIALRCDAGAGQFAVWYADHCYPVSPFDYGDILREAVGSATHASPLKILATEFATLRANEGHPDAVRARASVLKRRLAALCFGDDALRTAVERSAAAITGDKLQALCARQAWRLVVWTQANEHINYRRFFDITSLAGVRVEDPLVFEASHGLIFDLIAEGRIHGLRVDHVDGLADPGAYLRNLQSRVGPDFYIVIEKILEPGEHLPRWPIAGTTGYDALHTLDAIFFAADAIPTLDALQTEIAGAPVDRTNALSDIKTDLATHTFASEFAGLLADVSVITGNVGNVEGALRTLLAAFPVYRTYGDEQGFSQADRAVLLEARQVAASRLSTDQHASLDRVIDAIGRSPRALRRFQQLTGPLMAKSFEDTLFYRDARFIAANEVGCGPDHPDITPGDFHRANAERLADWPGSLLATSTHDTKRGEDARGRLLAASHDTEGWCSAWNCFRGVRGAHAIAPGDLYFMFQALIAAAPLTPSKEEATAFAERASAFSEKYLREGKQRSSWIEPDTSYEKAVRAFIQDCATEQGVLFRDLAPYVAHTASAGAQLGIARTVLKCTIPGVPDTYQGSELADLAFVDPDNRRPVDYHRRADVLSRPHDPADGATFVGDDAKLVVLARLLADRRDHPATYAGAYEPLATSDDRQVIAFQRGSGSDALIVIARRNFGQAGGSWRLTLPSGQWRNLFAVRTLQGGREQDGPAVLGNWPAVALRRTE